MASNQDGLVFCVTYKIKQVQHIYQFAKQTPVDLVCPGRCLKGSAWSPGFKLGVHVTESTQKLMHDEMCMPAQILAFYEGK